jgi:hypothetical protein
MAMVMLVQMALLIIDLLPWYLSFNCINKVVLIAKELMIANSQS